MRVIDRVRSPDPSCYWAGGNPVSRCSNPVSADHIYLDQSSTWNISSIAGKSKSILMLTSFKYPKVLSPSSSAGSSEKSKGCTPSSGLTIGNVCAGWAPETASEEGCREYAGSNKAAAVPSSPSETGYSYNDPGAECESEPCSALSVRPDSNPGTADPENDTVCLAESTLDTEPSEPDQSPSASW